MIGQTIAHYQIIEKIGQGGMGTVYKAKDLKLDRYVALKFLPHDFVADEEMKTRFVQEAKAASFLDHSNICTIHQIDETEDGQMFIAMAYYEGETVKEKMERGPFSFTEAIHIAIQVAEALKAAHNQGIIHRDIKPGNIMVTKENAVKLLDFGLAKRGDVDLTQSQTYLGTLAYMSPEQLRGEKVDHRTDIWSLGVVLYQMLTGELPFKGEYPQAMLYLILNEDSPPPSGLRPEIPEELANIIQTALQKDPQNRYQTIQEMQHDLKALQDPSFNYIRGKSSHIRPIVKGKRIIAYVGILVILVLAGILIRSRFLSQLMTSSKPLNRDRIAVLPFDDISADEGNEYFAEGMTEELISSLSQISDFEVIARTSVMRYKNTARSVKEIGNELGVGTVLTGSIRKANRQLRITIRLIDVHNEVNLWSRDYNRELRDIFAIQTDIARSVTAELKGQLKQSEKEQLAKKSTGNIKAYTLYLKGRYNWNRRTPQTLRKAASCFQQAVEEDSSYALAYTGLADAYALFGSTEYGIMAPTEVLPKAKAAALKAVRIDNNLAEAHTSLANIKLFYDWDFEGARKEFEKALQLNPNYATAHHWYAIYLMAMGKFEQAQLEIKKAREWDAVSLVINMDVGWILHYAREYDRAVAQIKETLQLDENFVIAHVALGLTYCMQSKYDMAIDAFQKARELSGGHPMALASMGYAYAKSGKNKMAQKLLDQLIAVHNKNKIYIPPLYVAFIYAGMEDKNRIFEWINEAYRERSGYLVYLRVDPKVDYLRDDPRFEELLNKIGFPEGGAFF